MTAYNNIVKKGGYEMQNLSDFSKTNSSIHSNKNTESDSTFSVVELINKYSRCSQDELIKEFFNHVEKQKREGNFDKNKIVNIANSVMPLLNSQQQIMIKELLNKV